MKRNASKPVTGTGHTLYNFNYMTRSGVVVGQRWANSRWDVEEYCRSQPDYWAKNSEYVWAVF